MREILALFTRLYSFTFLWWVLWQIFAAPRFVFNTAAQIYLGLGVIALLCYIFLPERYFHDPYV